MIHTTKGSKERMESFKGKGHVQELNVREEIACSISFVMVCAVLVVAMIIH